MDAIFAAAHIARSAPLPVVAAIVSLLAVGVLFAVYLVLYFTAPVPRAPLQSEKTFTFITEDGTKRKHQPLPCWYDKYVAEKEVAQREGKGGKISPKVEIEAPEVYVSLVVPAFNEEERLGIMLTEAAEYLEQNYGPSSSRTLESQDISVTPSKSSSKKSNPKKTEAAIDAAQTSAAGAPSGYEIIIVSDGSTDRTTETALNFARKQLPEESRPAIRVVSLEHNRGKGGAVTHGLRHVRGSYALFADADGATRFSDLGAVLDAARAIELKNGSSPPGHFPAVSVGSRAHMVNTPAVVKRSALRNLLMRGFHIFLRLMTPPATAHIGDTQCGFKLFSRGSLPAIVPWMHSEGWIFDVEMLMLAESAGIAVAEVPVGWKEVKGSKLNVVWDSLGMAWGLAVLRGSWLLGVYKRKW